MAQPIVDRYGRPMRSTNFSYDAAKKSGKRRSASVRHVSEDKVLNQAERGQLSAESHNLRRNYAVVGWAIRKHLDYVTRFRFRAKTGHSAFDDTLAKFIRKRCLRYNCDSSARHPFRRMVRLAEAMMIIHGDVGFLKRRNMTLQAIEGDRVRDFTNIPAGMRPRGKGEEWTHGVRVQDGQSMAYAVHKRTGNGFSFERIVPARNMLWHANYERFDQVRGISPIVSAINSFKDTYEASELALAKMKVSQLMALALFYKDKESGDGIEPEKFDPEEDEGEEEPDQVKIDFDRHGPIQLDLDSEDKVEFLESKTPSTEFQTFNQFHISVGLKALDIPFSFFDESFTNFYGSRAASVQYVRACEDKRDNVQELIRPITYWWIVDGILTGELVLPGRMTIDDMEWEWVPDGVPWWDASKEVNGDLQKISAGLDNPIRICTERGTGDFFEHVDAIAECIEYANKKGVPLSFLPVPQQINVVEKDEE